MSLLQVAPKGRPESNRASEPYADEDSSILADLTSMFPSLDHDVIVTVLQAHDGRIQAAVEYLVTAGEQAMSGANLPLLHTDHTALGLYDPARDMVGYFSEDIGGLPEVLPAILCEGDTSPPSPNQSSEGGGSEGRESDGSPILLQQGDDDNDPLPTYEEACQEPSQRPLISEGDSHSEEPEIQGALPGSPTEDMSAGLNGAEATHDKKKSEYCTLDCLIRGVASVDVRIHPKYRIVSFREVK